MSNLRIGTAIPVSPAHSFDRTKFQIGDGTDAGRETGDMLGFARDLYRRSDSPQQVMAAWLASAPHCENIMKHEFAEMGAAYAVNQNSDSLIYWTQVFGTRR